jgi:hypothetical protein
MCKCNKGMRNSNGSQMRPPTQGDNVVAIYSNPSQLETIRVFDSIDKPTRYLGMARHGYPISVPAKLLNIPRVDGSMFVLPENFTPEPPPFSAAGQPIKKPKKVKVEVAPDEDMQGVPSN